MVKDPNYFYFYFSYLNYFFISIRFQKKMDSKQAITILADIEIFLQFSYTRLTLMDLENNNYNIHSDNILPEFTFFKHIPSNIRIDNGSCYLLPEGYKDMVCGQSTADGNWNWFLDQQFFQLRETNIHLEKNTSFIKDIFHFNDNDFSNECDIQNLSDEGSDEDEIYDHDEMIASLMNQWSYKINNNLFF